MSSPVRPLIKVSMAATKDAEASSFKSMCDTNDICRSKVVDPGEYPTYVTASALEIKFSENMSLFHATEANLPGLGEWACPYMITRMKSLPVGSCMGEGFDCVFESSDCPKEGSTKSKKLELALAKTGATFIHKMVGKNWQAVIESACRNARQLRAQKEELVEQRHVEVLTSEGSAETRKAEADNLAGVERAHKKHRASTTINGPINGDVQTGGLRQERQEKN